MFGDKSKRAEKKAKWEQARIKAKENPVIAILSGEGMLDQITDKGKVAFLKLNCEGRLQTHRKKSISKCL